MVGLLELLVGIVLGIGISDALDSAKPIYPNDSTKVSTEYYIIYQDRYFGKRYGYSLFNDYWWHTPKHYNYYYGYRTQRGTDVPLRTWGGKNKGKKSGEYTKPKTRRGGGGKGRNHRGNKGK
jgi:hypothetical protein